MAGNRAIFERAMEQSREAARGGRWEESLKSAIRALQEFPQDTDARIAAAVALFNTGKLDRALQIFTELRAADPNNAFHLNYIAQGHSRQGNTQAAIESYRALADLHISQRRPAQAVEPLREILNLRPDMDDQRQRLARLFEEIGSVRDAANEYLALARRLHEAQQYDRAAEAAETVLRLDPNSREAKDLIITLRDAMARAAGMASQPAPTSHDLPIHATSMTGMLRSQQFQAEKLVEQAMKRQEAGDADGAADLYEQAIASGLERADVFYSLGLIYQERNDHKSAVGVLNRAANDPEYALSAHFALGQSHRELGQLPQAAQEFEQTIGLVDLESIGRAEADDLINMYESAATIYSDIGDIARAAALYSTLADFLESKRWGRERAGEFKARAKELSERNMFAKLRTVGTGALTPQAASAPTPHPSDDDLPGSWGKIRPITDFLRNDRPGTTGGLGGQPEPKPISEPILILETMPTAIEPNFPPATQLDTTGLDSEAEKWVMISGNYLNQGLIEAALDACHEVIRINVDYLPIHLRMGEIYERQGRPEEALTKYQLLIDTFRVRNEPEKAIDVYFRYIELSPDTTNARARLAEILKNAGRVDEAVEQSIHVANTYYRLGQTNKALEEYRRLLQWAPKNRDVHMQYGLALLKLERFEAALDEFRKAMELGSADDLIAIARLNITLALMGTSPADVWDSLATLLDQLKQHPQEFGSVQTEYRSAMLIADASILHYILAIIQQQAGQHNSALLELEQAQAIIGSEEDTMLAPVLIYQASADSHIAQGNAEAALKQLHKGQAVAAATISNPNIKHAFAVPLSKGDLARRMAEAYAASEDLQGAEQALLEAKKLVPYDRMIHTKLADIYFRQGKLPEALAQLEELATYYEDGQQLDRAIEMFEYALKLAPNHIAISGRLARLQLRRGYLDKGVDGLMRAAELMRKAGQLKDAVASLQEAAQVHWMLSQHEKARQVYDKIVQIAPNDVEARQWLALMHTLARRTSEAIAEKKQIARIFAQQRDYDGAIAELHQIIGIDQKDLEAYYLLGDMLMRREEYSQAAQLYSRMLKMEGVEKERVEALASAANRMLQQRQSQQKG
ncbi:Tetratricopeptide TPR_2 repeat protein [Oscillochloris trichoides DG-6]|uniref:Tetratricopeptide TPR_2 repeat protein n=1 Tax=Oscillochloris trichoides DG-6 TaxID=765420 RepID=E1IHL9_9CHLR|nr:tetratricopeptide repeat protein [Oscillochloris trichoides]EFO79318.1 Tetratricopeptide TPR_2 repeat protein [Oscillochloris trichoides DG-6]